MNVVLFAFLLAACLGYWLSGRLANLLYRSLYGTDHPKFD